VTYRLKKDGSRSYAMGWQDDRGWHWKSVPGGEKDAVAARAEIIRRLGRGENVAPSCKTFSEVSEEWKSASFGRLGLRTREKYEGALDRHLVPRFGKRKLTSLTDADVVALIASLEGKGLAPWTIRGVLVPLSRVFNFAVKRRYIGENPCRRLDRDDRPPAKARRAKRILEPKEIAALLASASTDRYRALLAVALGTGMRQSELLGLTWAQVDFDRAVIRVDAQLCRVHRNRKELKTDAARREIVMTSDLATVLRKHRLASRFTADTDYVFCTIEGRPLTPTNVDRRALHAAAERAELRAPRPRWHDLRDTFASAAIAAGADVVFLSRMLGHANPSITLSIYAHEFARAQHGDKMRTLLEGAFGASLSGKRMVGTDGQRRATDDLEELQEAPFLHAVGTGGHAEAAA
jgi:integrase